VRGTVVSVRDVLQTLSRPLLSGIVAGALAFGLRLYCGQLLHPLPRLALGVAFFICVYLGMLLYVMGQRAFYVELVRGLRRRSSVEESALASA
jgi:hypothetical protein